MPLSDISRQLLNACAERFATATASPTFDLRGLVPDFGQTDEIVACLAAYTNYHSQGRLTVRRADEELFANPIRGQALYVVVCGANTPDGVVSELRPHMLLASLTPFSNGFTFPEEPRYAALVQQQRQALKILATERPDEAAALNFALSLAEAAMKRLDQLDSTELRPELYGLLAGDPQPSLDLLAYVCRRLGITLVDLARDLP